MIRARHTTFSPLVGLAACCLALGAFLHLLQLLSLGPWSLHWPGLTTWPTGFHLWVAETGLLVLGIACVAAHLMRDRWQLWLFNASGKRRAAILVMALAVLQLLLALAFWLTRNKGVDQLGGLRAAFWLGGEFRLPTLFAVLQAWLAGWLAWQCRRFESMKAIWTAAAMVCVYIGFDEMLSIHEAVGRQVLHWLRDGGWFEFDSKNTMALWGGIRTYTWKLVFLPFAALVGLWLLHGFLRVLDRRAVLLLVVAALLFVGGAVGFETVEATRRATDPTWPFSTASHLNLLLEETFETAGMTVAIYVFAKHLWRHSADVQSVSRARNSDAGLHQSEFERTVVLAPTSRR